MCAISGRLGSRVSNPVLSGGESKTANFLEPEELGRLPFSLFSASVTRVYLAWRGVCPGSLSASNTGGRLAVPWPFTPTDEFRGAPTPRVGASLERPANSTAPVQDHSTDRSTKALATRG